MTWHCECQTKCRQNRCKSFARLAQEVKPKAPTDWLQATAERCSMMTRHSDWRALRRRQSIPDHILSLCISFSVKAVAAESSPFIVVTDHFSDGIDIDTSVYQ